MDGGFNLPYCQDCDSYDVDVDYTRGDTICIHCGCVVDCDGLGLHGWNTVTHSSSKGYQTLVYVREKLRSLHGTDPWIWDSHFDLIKEKMEEVYSFETEAESWNRLQRSLGPKTFGEICRSVTNNKGEFFLKNKKYGERWIQARARLGFNVPDPMPEELLRDICIRTYLLQMAHRNHFQNKLTGKNTRNLNFWLCYCIKLFNPDLLKEWKYFIKLSPQKLREYNQTLKEQLVVLGGYYSRWYNKEDQIVEEINWDYVEIFEGDIYVPSHRKYI